MALGSYVVVPAGDGDVVTPVVRALQRATQSPVDLTARVPGNPRAAIDLLLASGLAVQAPSEDEKAAQKIPLRLRDRPLVEVVVDEDGSGLSARLLDRRGKSYSDVAGEIEPVFRRFQGDTSDLITAVADVVAQARARVPGEARAPLAVSVLLSRTKGQTRAPFVPARKEDRQALAARIAARTSLFTSVAEVVVPKGASPFTPPTSALAALAMGMRAGGISYSLFGGFHRDKAQATPSQRTRKKPGSATGQRRRKQPAEAKVRRSA